MDEMEEAVDIAAGDIEEAPDPGSTISAENIRGMAKLKGRVVTLMDIDRVLAEKSAHPRRWWAATPVRRERR